MLSPFERVDYESFLTDPINGRNPIENVAVFVARTWLDASAAQPSAVSKSSLVRLQTRRAIIRNNATELERVCHTVAYEY